MKRLKVGLIVDHPKRDLDGIVLLAYQLSRRGVEPVIVPMYAQGMDIPLLGLDAVVANYARPANHALLKAFADAGVAVFVLDTEGGVLAETGGNSPPAMAEALKARGFSDFVAGYFLWGPVLRDAFAQARALPETRLYVTGCPRFDFAAPKWRDLLTRERRGYLLVNANFPLVNPRFSRSPEAERKSMVAAGWDAAYVDRLLADLHQVFGDYLRTIRAVAEQRPAMRFLVRPHPFESEAPYREALAGLANVEIDPAGSVLIAIHNSAGIIHLNCGTAVEAVMLGKLPIQMEFLNTQATANHAKLPARASEKANSFDDLLAILDGLAERTERFDFAGKYGTHVAPFFYENDGNGAARVADGIIATLAQAGNRGGWRSPLASLMNGRRRPRLGQLLQGALAVSVGTRFSSALRTRLSPSRGEKAIASRRVEELLASFARHEGLTAVPKARHAPGLLGAPLASIAIEAQ